MTNEEIIEMAREANLPSCLATHPKALERFATLIAEKEREACANTAGLALLGADKALTDRVLKAIRARGKSNG